MSLRGLAQQVSLDAEGRYQPMHTAVAVDRDKNSHQAVRWAIDYFAANNPTIVIVHVRNPATLAYGDTSPDAAREQIEAEAAELFLSYRGFCARKGVAMKEIILEESDVSKALVEFIIVNNISNIVVGSSSRNAITRKFRNPDVPTNLMKFAPDFCTVYLISKGKPASIRQAKVHAPPPGVPRQPLIPASPRHYHSGSMECDEASRMPLSRGSWRGQIPPSPVAEKRSLERNGDYMRTPTRDVVRQLQPGKPAAGNVLPYENAEGSFRPSRAPSRESFSDDLDFHGAAVCQSSDTSADLMEHIQPPFCESPPDSIPPEAAANGDVEAELRRLRLELKQTMDMYSTACKEAISAKQKARELNQWKQEELRRVEEARQAEEAARAMVELEKAKCRAALEAAEAAHRLAEREAQKRLSAEMVAKREAVEKKRALEALNNNDVRYRKYTIEEIELATDFFAQSLKIGEGGYGPVYKACLDHTPVAIKVLRPDAAQGRKQFLQEVEVLSRIRHPNMVLLLGACPEYGCLVYEYMDNGSLEDRLLCRGNSPPIPWHVRFKIAAEIATALLFLHQTKPEPLVHRDLKPANILLDRNYVSKISDVGLARLVPPSVANAVTQYHMTSTAGTFCYIDPEYQQTGMLGTKSDVYSLGIMLMQIITAKPPMGLAHHVQRAIDKGVFDEMLDPSVPDWPVEDALGYAKLALQCAELKRKDRPDLATVVLPELNRLRNLWDRQEASYGSGGRSVASGSTGSTPSGFSFPRPPRSATPPTSSQCRPLRNSAVQVSAPSGLHRPKLEEAQAQAFC